MPAVRIGPKHQVTIPKAVFDDLQLKAGDFLEATAHGGKILLSPLQVTAKAPTPRLTAAEQRLLGRARAKIALLQRDARHTRGLTAPEAKIAAKAGLIDPDQAYWWTETWQRGEREARADLGSGKVLGPFASVQDLTAARVRHPRL